MRVSPAFPELALRRRFAFREDLRLHLFPPNADGKISRDGRFKEKGEKGGIAPVSGAPWSRGARSGRRRYWARRAPEFGGLGTLGNVSLQNQRPSVFTLCRLGLRKVLEEALPLGSGGKL